MYHFHVNLFADPKEASFACTWEDAAAKLELLPRMIFELDGSFVISASISEPSEPGRPRPRVQMSPAGKSTATCSTSPAGCIDSNSTANARPRHSTNYCAASAGRGSRSCSKWFAKA